MKEEIRAIGLVSGGLDSILALKVIADQDINVIAVHLHSGFDRFQTPKRHHQQNIQSDPIAELRLFCEREGIDLREVDMSPGYLDVIHNPRYGYGRNVNPCVDCHIHMLRTVRERMERWDADFVFTGEVLGQRPMSQQMNQLNSVANGSGLGGLLIRPLSAKLLPGTIPEENGWIDRESMLDLQGRNRKPQIALAAEYGIKEYPTPGGGCCLTDPGFAVKVKDLWTHQGKEHVEWQDYSLLKIGRHLRVSEQLKVIVGRNEEENNLLDGFKTGFIKAEVNGIPGPIVLAQLDKDDIPESDIETIARITARYSDAKDSNEPVQVDVSLINECKAIEVLPFRHEQIKAWIIK